MAKTGRCVKFAESGGFTCPGSCYGVTQNAAIAHERRRWPRRSGASLIEKETVPNRRSILLAHPSFRPRARPRSRSFWTAFHFEDDEEHDLDTMCLGDIFGKP